jgi:serine/threonine-protein kinase
VVKKTDPTEPIPPLDESDDELDIVAAAPTEGFGLLKARLRHQLFATGESDNADSYSLVLDGRYGLLEPLGSGGMGIVYRAKHVQTGKIVAVKMLRTEHGQDPTFYARFVREAKIASQIDHPNVVGVHDSGEHEGMIYYVMDYLEGEDLGRRLRRVGQIDAAQLRQFALQVLEGLAAAHARGIVHRDLKPDNLYLVKAAPADHVRILDFGIAKVFRADETGASLTTEGRVLGTPHYMSPEQALGAQPDDRSDIYSLGVVLYEGLTGRRPFSHKLLVHLLKLQIEAPPSPFTEVAPDLDVDPRLEAIVQRALAKRPEDRFQTVVAMSAAIAGLE